ncbi:uncharacterized protein LOC115679593 [Syzygium oleosum]|uniref:uncharacterized protein LOC115679593 n=1 Tax=Syzygium oleosum TaxID=219896 RepID=UPI0011D1C445|nr:uncharacterized protein LOC115679593 [Syzygium oleosum]
MNNRGKGTRGQSSSQARPMEDPRVNGVLRALEAIGQLMGQQAQERVAAAIVAAEAAAVAAQDNPGNGNGNCQMHQVVEQFLKLKPPKFNGKGDPEPATLWVEELEKAFELLGCTEEEKVAVYQLQGNASDWWKATRGRIFPEGMVQNWDAFVEAFNVKYFSKNAQEKKMAEFIRLRKNQMTVDQYEAEFARLSKFAPRMVENHVDKARRFRDGLKPKLRSQLILLNLRDYNELYERAQIVERDMTERAAASGSRYAQTRDNRNFGKKPMVGNRRFVPPIRKNIGKSTFYSSAPCRSCERRHENGPCLGRNGACYGCGQHGHQVKGCSN